MRQFIYGCIFLFALTGLAAEERKVALLFLTRTDLNHTQLWKEWIDLSKYTVYNHAKNQVKDPWFAQFRIAQTCPTTWANTMLAQQVLLRTALKDPNNYKFVFLTESCIPLRAADQVYELLTAEDNSYMAYKNVWWDEKNTRTLSEFPIQYHRGNGSWFILNRKHAQMIADDTHWILLASKHPIDNESYPSTFLCMKGVLHEVNNFPTTFVDWKRSEGSSPYTFKKPTKENLDLLRKAKQLHLAGDVSYFCLFARKFAPEFPIDVLRQLQVEE